nr:putative PEP-binding protein [Petrachloros mirabilis]
MLPLAQTQNLALPEVGYQGLALSHLAQSGYPVLPGSIIPVEGFRQFLSTIEWQAPLLQSFPQLDFQLDINQADQLQQIAHLIQQRIVQTPLPVTWSEAWLAQCANAAYLRLLPSLWVPETVSRDLGLLEGLLTVQFCRGAAPALERSVKALWSQLFEAKTLFFWQQSGLPFEEVQLAIVVQPLAAVRASGFLQMTPTHGIIQATYGLSHSLYEGHSTPDYYEVSRRTGHIEQHLGAKSYAYYLRPPQPSDSASANEAFKGTAIEMARQHQFALSPTDLQTLMQIGQQLTNSWQTAVLEWMLIKTSARQTQFVLSRVFDQHPIPDCPPSHSRPMAGSATTPHGRVLAEGVGAATGQAIATAWVTHDLSQDPPPTDGLHLLVIPELQPKHLPWLHQAAGLVCERGGMTSHGAIVARELNLPAVVGVDQATQLLQSGQTLLIDGDLGRIYEVDPRQPQPAIPTSRSDGALEPEQGGSSPLATQIWVNLSQAGTIERVQDLAVDGVGLLRSEWLLMDALEQQHPSRWMRQGRQTELLRRFSQRIEVFARAFYPRPVWYRALDLRSPDLAMLIGGAHMETPEANPMLGLRGVARSLGNRSLFTLELAALAALAEEGLDNLRLLLPFVRSVHEFQGCRQLIQRAGLLNLPQFQVWIMAEVPSILFLLPDYVEAGVQGIAIGTNDLTQLLLGVDRDQPTLATQFNEHHPVVVAAVNQLIRTARALDLPCSVCGQAPVRYPDLIQGYVASGVTALSVEVNALMQTRQWVSQAEEYWLASLGGRSPYSDAMPETQAE